MSAKIIVQKFEQNNICKSLHITIGENDKDLSDIKFSVWQDGEAEMKKKDKDKPRLVVKMFSDENIYNKNYLNFDSCYKTVDYTDKYLNDILSTNIHKDEKNSNLGESNKNLDLEKKYWKAINGQPMFNNLIKQEYKKAQFNTTKYHFYNRTDDGIDPLECCLEKVKKNNALIMENIHMLNRTLNYTKKKEILDIINPKPLRSYPCNACNKCFVYETGLRRHYSLRHANLDTQPHWQLVWTCTECFQVWPREDLAMEHAKQCCNSNNIDIVQEIKTSSLLQCEFCEKVFTCIPRLVTHTKMHLVTNNYQCNACNVAFSCYKTAEQHWTSCLWLRTCYQFALAKMLLCNSCDRKFKNYDQLYNHRLATL